MAKESRGMAKSRVKLPMSNSVLNHLELDENRFSHKFPHLGKEFEQIHCFPFQIPPMSHNVYAWHTMP